MANQVNSSIDIMSAFINAPPEIDFVWPGFVVGTVGALVAQGETGKSFWALEAAMAVASTSSSGDVLRLYKKHSGGYKVIYVAAEDPVPILINRIHFIGRFLDQQAREDIATNLTILPVMGNRDLDVMQLTFCDRLIKLCAGARLLVLDTISRMHRRDEKDNGAMAQLVSMLEHIAASTGSAVLFLHHVSKVSIRDGQTDQQQAARGATSLVDNSRWCGYVSGMTADEAKLYGIESDRKKYYVRFGVSKQNYAAKSDVKWYERAEGGVLKPVELIKEVKISTMRKAKEYEQATY